MDAAVIGCGRMGVFTSEGVRRFAPSCWFPLSHAEAITAHPSLRLAALADPQPDALARALTRYGEARGFSDGVELLEAVRPKLVGIATRTIGRQALIAQACQSGALALHVEKPLCNSVQELTTLESMFERHRLYMTFGAIRRHLQPYLQARALVESGRLGRLVEIEVAMGAGALYWTHPHSLDLILFAAGRRRVVSATARLSRVEWSNDKKTVITDPMVESAAVLFEDGVEGRISRRPGCDLLLACERGFVTVEGDGHAVVVREFQGEDAYLSTHHLSIDASSAATGTGAAIGQLVACLHGDEDSVSANALLRHDILLGQRLLFAMVQSHRQNGQAVSPQELDPTLCIMARTNAQFA